MLKTNNGKNNGLITIKMNDQMAVETKLVPIGSLQCHDKAQIMIRVGGGFSC